MLIDHIKCSVRNLRRSKLRSLLTITGIAIGVASVIIIASIGDIGKYTVNSEIESFGIGGVTIRPSRSSLNAPFDKSQLDIIKQHADVESAVPIMMEVSEINMRGLVAESVIWGIDNGAKQIISLELLHGRLINKNDVENERKVCVLDQKIAESFYKRDNIVGKNVEMLIGGKYEKFDIVGIVSSNSSVLNGIIGELVPSFLFMPYTTLQSLSGKESFSQIAVKVAEGSDIDLVGDQLVSRLNRNVGIRGAFQSENIFRQKEKLNNIMNIITIVLSAIAGISLVVAGLGIMTVMLVSVNERTKEIGIKKSIGANKAVILLEFITEAFTLSVIGSITGTSFGVLAVLAGCIPFGLPVIINLKLLFICVLFSVLMGVLFGAYPASMAAKMKPVDALRYE